MQGADAGMGVPGTVGAVLAEHLGQAVGVVCQVLQRHRAVLDERHRLPVALHRHHDVQAGAADLGDLRLEGRVLGAHHGVWEAEVAHHGVEVVEPPQQGVALLAGELDHQQGLGLALHESLDDRPEHGDLAGEVHHRAVDQLDRVGFQGHQVPGRGHGLAEGREVADPHDPVLGNRMGLQADAPRQRQRAFRADQQGGHVMATARVPCDDPVEVVAADLAHQLGDPPVDLRRLAVGDGAHGLHEVAVALRPGQLAEVAGHMAEAGLGAVHQDGVDGLDVVDHDAVVDRPAAAGVVRRHAADGGARGGRHVDREQPAPGLELRVEVVEHDARLDRDLVGRLVVVRDLAQIFGAVQHQGGVHGLAALRGAAAARQDRDALLAGDLHGHPQVLLGARNHHADRLDLVDRGVGRVAAAAERVEQHLALDLATEAGGERGIADAGLQGRHDLFPPTAC